MNQNIIATVHNPSRVENKNKTRKENNECNNWRSAAHQQTDDNQSRGANLLGHDAAEPRNHSGKQLPGACSFGGGAQCIRNQSSEQLQLRNINNGSTPMTSDPNQADLDNHANQLNDNNDAYWQSRGEDERPEDWQDRREEE